MPYKMEWIVSKRVFRVTQWGSIDRDEIMRRHADILHHIHTGNPPVYCISDVRDIKSFSITPEEAVKIASYTDEPNLAFTVMVGASSAMQGLRTHVARTKRGINSCMVDNMHDALDYLFKLDGSLAFGLPRDTDLKRLDCYD